ncbi:alpha/beta hydrolase [Amycolatopsis ultiminotia]|uniref:Alpha/beta hydrolase n=1 Tax=Amycolatopsis ultiminotia TaxID=543629 RepID=A0ABP6W155_9PSEU
MNRPHDDRPGLPPVVLTHGWGGSAARTWRGSLLESALVDAGRTVVAVDLPGHGPGRASHDPGDYADLAEQLSATLPSRRPLDAVGFSLGGKLLLRLAADAPGRFRRLVILGVGHNAFAPENAELIATALLDGTPDGAPEEFRTLMTEARTSGNDPHALAAVIRRPTRLLDHAALQRIEAQVLLVVGEDDPIAGPPDELAAALPTGRLVRIPGLGHCATPAAPQVQDAVATFLMAQEDHELRLGIET